MSRTTNVDLCVIGAGSGGLSVAAGAAQMGARVVLIEKHKMGGDCLNYGCVPSKALLAAAHAAETIRRSGRFGVNGHEPAVDFAAVNRHVHGVIAGIAPHDSVERFEGLGVDVRQGAGRFVGPREVMVNDETIRAKFTVVATGSRAAIPEIAGLHGVPYLTNETIFDLATAPERLIVLGGGPIGCELAQAHRRLGVAVTLVTRRGVLPKDDPECGNVVARTLAADGIELVQHAETISVARSGNGIAVKVCQGEQMRRLEGSHLLVATGRRANVEGLDLDKAGIATYPAGISVDERLRTSNRRVFAIGDVTGGPQFTHMAGHQAGVVIRNTLFRMPAKAEKTAVPWVTFTDPELAHVGLGEAAARERHGDRVTVVRVPFSEIDRARAERRDEGFAKVVIGKGGRILGCTIVGAHAGELLLPWVLAIGNKLKIGAMAGVIAPYPTLGDISKRAAGAYFTPTLFSPRVKRVVRTLLAFA
ncbi:dihydrolipoyl dehydrogenase family protein [Oceanibacterium hippocampi]|uniref:Mercuric reductase n=1 Tax=Oceanibacterium hippocampi TaxID=745714 RepID=A0A1Y5S6E0_9PROT|nr:FAD-dependent oxidoreductase [Oceanibacterium hippocampi]SLN32279.1 Mercuric reductase [Oceanibacterium hippocampi]